VTNQTGDESDGQRVRDSESIKLTNQTGDESEGQRICDLELIKLTNQTRVTNQTGCRIRRGGYLTSWKPPDSLETEMESGVQEHSQH